MIHVTTGNRFDVVYDYEDGKQRFIGIKPWDGELLKLPRPRDFAQILIKILDECEASK